MKNFDQFMQAKILPHLQIKLTLQKIFNMKSNLIRTIYAGSISTFLYSALHFRVSRKRGGFYRRWKEPTESEIFQKNGF